MGIHKYKPMTPGRRFSSVFDLIEVTRDTSEESLLCLLHKTGGRDNNGRVASRHRDGDHERQYHAIDFRHHDRDGVSATVAHIEYDPNRTARIALLHYADGEKCYILVPTGLKQDDRIGAGVGADIRPGSSLQLHNIPLDTIVHAVGLYPGGGAKITRSAGTSVQLVAREDRFAQLRMPPSEIHDVEVTCRATIGEVDNAEQSNISWGKADHIRWKGKRPHVRGVVINPVGHPHGGGEGRTSDDRHPMSPWGKPGGRMRRPKKASDHMIVRRHKTGKDH